LLSNEEVEDTEELLLLLSVVLGAMGTETRYKTNNYMQK
jgi:hypothetical protein